MVWSRSLRVFLVIVLAVALTVLGLLAVPSLVHSSGAELSWSRFGGPSVFDRYEVHRAATAGFTPVSSGPGSTLLATIRDIDTTSWVDTTAAPSPSGTTKYFWYKVVVNGTDASNEQKVTMPTAGLATLTLQPGPSDGGATYMVTNPSSTTPCISYLNYGGAANLRIGISATGYRHRPLLRFDLRRIPPGAQVTSAQLTLWHGLSVAAPDEIDLYRVTRAWEEGRADYPGVCDGSGADWKEARAGVVWSAAGHDFDATQTPAKATRNTTAGYDGFGLIGMVHGWVNGGSPTFRMLLKLKDDQTPTATNKYFDYHSDDYATASQRPRLVVSFADGSHTVSPSVTLATPAAGARVHGMVEVTAAASDDGAVTGVSFVID